MSQQRVDLAGIFQSVTQMLAENQQALNQADEYNQDHGNNMLQTFQTITEALQQKKGASDSAALSYAAKKLAKQTTSGSGQLYAQNLAQAANLFKGKQIDLPSAIALLQTLIGGGQGSGGDLLGSLLGGLAGGGTAASQQAAPAGGDLLGSLLGGLMGGSSPTESQPSQPAGVDLLGSLLGGLTGGGGLSSLAQAFLSGSRMGDTTHRTQSTQVVVDSFLKSLGTMGESR